MPSVFMVKCEIFGCCVLGGSCNMVSALVDLAKLNSWNLSMMSLLTWKMEIKTNRYFGHGFFKSF
jgi:hypothetical protein